MHLWEGHKQPKLSLPYIQFEQRSAPDDLQFRQDDGLYVHVTDQHIARHLADVLQEA